MSGIVEQRLVAAVGLRHAQRLGLLLRGRLAAAGDRHDVDEAEPPHRVDVMRADESGADDTHPDSFQARIPGSLVLKLVHARLTHALAHACRGYGRPSAHGHVTCWAGT